MTHYKILKSESESKVYYYIVNDNGQTYHLNDKKFRRRKVIKEFAIYDFTEAKEIVKEILNGKNNEIAVTGYCYECDKAEIAKFEQISYDKCELTFSDGRKCNINIEDVQVRGYIHKETVRFNVNSESADLLEITKEQAVKTYETGRVVYIQCSGTRPDTSLNTLTFKKGTKDGSFNYVTDGNGPLTEYIDFIQRNQAEPVKFYTCNSFELLQLS